jgi:cell division control protein 24
MAIIHHLENFGELLLGDIFVVIKPDIDPGYYVFLFEKIILYYKQAPSVPPNARAKAGEEQFSSEEAGRTSNHCYF